MGWMKKKRLRTPPPMRAAPHRQARRVTKAARRWAALDADFDEWLLGDGPPVATPAPPVLLPAMPAQPAGALRPTAVRPTVMTIWAAEATRAEATQAEPIEPASEEAVGKGTAAAEPVAEPVAEPARAGDDDGAQEPDHEWWVPEEMGQPRDD